MGRVRACSTVTWKIATDRIYRLMIAQRIRHRDSVEATNTQGIAVRHTPEFVSELFDEELGLPPRNAKAEGSGKVHRPFRFRSAQIS